MKKIEFLEQLKCAVINAETVDKICSIYGFALPHYVAQFVSFSTESIFFEDEWRTLSHDEIIDAEEDLHVDFAGKSMLPLIDCGENDFIVYCHTDGVWAKFNIVDECLFSKRSSLDDLFQ